MQDPSIFITEHREIAAIADFDTIRKLQDTAEIISQFDLTLTERNNLVKKQGFLAIRAGELYAGLKDETYHGGANQYIGDVTLGNATSKQDAEETLGKSRKTIAQWVKLAYLNNAYRRVIKYCEECNQTLEEATITGLYGALLNVIADRFTGNEENYTPKDVIDDVRLVLGEIDLDPASCEMAQGIVNAKTFFTKEDNGLAQRWWGRVFLNPPYRMPLIQQFTDKLLDELSNIEAAILLTNDQTDTLWFHKCANNATSLCLPKGRISFYTAANIPTAPTNGQTFFYFGNNKDRFIKTFSKRGLIVEVVRAVSINNS